MPSISNGESGASVRAKLAAAGATFANGATGAAVRSAVNALLTGAGIAAIAAGDSMASVRTKLNTLLAAPASAYLPAVSSGTAKVAVGARRMVSGYNGNLYRLSKANGSTMDVAPAAGSDLPDYAAINTWAAGATIYVIAWYDQFTGVSTGDFPYDHSPQFDTALAFAGCSPAIFAPSDSSDQGVTDWISLAVPTSGTGNNLTLFDVLAPEGSLVTNVHWSVATSSNATVYEAGTDSASRVGFNVAGGTASGAQSLLPRNQPSVVGVRANSSGTKLYVREQVLAGSGVQPATAFTTIWQGLKFEDAQNGNVGRYGRQRRWGMVAYSALSDAEALAVRDALTSIFSIPTSFTARLILDGDSIMERYASTRLKTLAHYMRAGGYIPTSTEVFNLAIAGQDALTINNSKASRILPLLTGGPTKGAYFGEQGINDLRGATTGTTLGTYRDSVAAYVKANSSYKVGFQRIMPQYGSATNDANCNSERVTYNSGTVAGGNIDAVADPNTNATLGTYPSSPQNTTYFDGGIHPKDPAIQLLAGIDGPVIASMLA